jgi:guanylate kinase
MPFTSKNNPILAIIGPSGVGKSTIIRQLYDKGLIHINPTWTTRPPRPNEESEGIEHKFVSENEFNNKQAEGYFLEVVEMFGLPYRYGVPKFKLSTRNKISLVMLRASLIPLLNKHYTNYTIYQIEDEIQKVRERLLARQKHGEDMGTRLEDYEKEVQAGKKLAKRTFVNNKSARQIAEQIGKAMLEDFVE